MSTDRQDNSLNEFRELLLGIGVDIDNISLDGVNPELFTTTEGEQPPLSITENGEIIEVNLAELSTENQGIISTLVGNPEDDIANVENNPRAILPSNIPEEDERTLRFSGAVWFQAIQQSTISLAGCGGIGSYVAFLLSRMNPARIILYDMDTVETVNMAGQLFCTKHIGMNKVNATNQNMINFSNYRSSILNQAYTENSGTSDIMICGFDNMDARKLYYNNWKIRVNNTPEDKRHELLFIDGRLAAEKFQVLSIQGDDPYSMNQYEKNWLFSSEEAVETLCSFKQTTYMANMIASTMVNVYTNFMANNAGSPIPRSVPFIIEYNGEFMDFNIEQ